VSIQLSWVVYKNCVIVISIIKF